MSQTDDDEVSRMFSEKIKSVFSPHWGKPVCSDEVATKSTPIRGYSDSLDVRCP